MDESRQQEMMRLVGEYRAEQGASLSPDDKRNADSADLFEAIIREVHEGVTFVAAGHHIMFTRQGHPFPGEIASADTLIFDHGIAFRIWGDDYRDVLGRLASEPAPGRDALLRQLYYGRPWAPTPDRGHD